MTASANAPAATGSQRSARNSIVLYLDCTGSGSAQTIFAPGRGTFGGMYGTGVSMTTTTSAFAGDGPVPESGCVVGKFSVIVRSESVIGSARSSARRTSASTDALLRPDWPRTQTGSSASMSHCAASLASAGSGHAGRATPSSAAVGKRVLPGSGSIAAS